MRKLVSPLGSLRRGIAFLAARGLTLHSSGPARKAAQAAQFRR